MTMKPRSIVLTMLICASIFVLIGIPIQANPSNETLTLHDIDVAGTKQSYYLYLPSNPKGAVLIIPSYIANHEELLDGNKWGEPDQSMENSPIVKAAREHQLALVFAQGANNDWYSPYNGEKKVLACLNDANITLKLSSDSWFIYGFSMGGAGALTISISHPKLFSGLYIGDGVMNFTNQFIIDSVTDLSGWTTPSEFFLDANPYRNIEVFRDKTVFLASGTNAGNLLSCDNFSQTLDLANIRHYYYRENDSHNVYLLFNSVNQTFDLFSHHLAGTLDQFYEGYTSPLKTKSTIPWGVNPIITAVIFLAIGWIAKKRRNRC
ncbi:hypothetical protein CEE45_10825 [Candidatus Heimdallarchaeota archaeon B3_Heim]|nr:MAG: hypothetical protein CEE45_10825 [Candidatus Heimdallarchaeota archaeon B3_Heim]